MGGGGGRGRGGGARGGGLGGDGVRPEPFSTQL